MVGHFLNIHDGVDLSDKKSLPRESSSTGCQSKTLGDQGIRGSAGLVWLMDQADFRRFKPSRQAPAPKASMPSAAGSGVAATTKSMLELVVSFISE